MCLFDKKPSYSSKKALLFPSIYDILYIRNGYSPGNRGGRRLGKDFRGNPFSETDEPIEKAIREKVMAFVHTATRAYK